MLYVQMFFGGGMLSARKTEKGIESPGMMRFTGNAFATLDIVTGKRWANIALDRNTTFEIFTDVAHVHVAIPDTDVNSLKLKLELRPPHFPYPRPPPLPPLP